MKPGGSMKQKGCLLLILSFLIIAAVPVYGALNPVVAPVKGEPEGRKVTLNAETVDKAFRYDIYKKAVQDEEWDFIISFTHLAPDMKFEIDNDTPSVFKIEALDKELNILEEAVTEPVVTKASWFNTKRSVRFIAMLLVSGIILYYIRKARQMREIYLRPIAGLKAFEEAVGRATEMGKSVLFVPGIMDLDQVETISGVIILGYVAKMTARYETNLNVPVSRSLVMEASREIVNESYLSEGRPDLFNPDMVHYYTDDQFAFAAAVDGIMLREKPAAVFLQGKFYAESLILAETGNSIGAIQIAGTGSPSQIPFFVTACDYTLIGEEFFAASAYLGKDPKLLGSIKGQDIIKGAIMVIILLGVVFESLGFSFFKNIFNL
jgi:hypothetical protein